MTPLDFLRAVCPPSGFYCIATPYQTGGMKHSVFEKIEDAAACAVAQSAHTNVYFAIHALRKERVWNQKHHKDAAGQWVADWSVRLQTNARTARAFFFDLDVGTDATKKYATQLDALAALKLFVAATGLPTPMIVSSGGGLHVYWLIDEELDSQSVWLTQARWLKQLAAHHGLKADPARTTDSASVLRVAGTLNHKGGAKKPVKVVVTGVLTPAADFEQILVSALQNVNVTPIKPILAAPASGLVSNLEKPEWDKAAPSLKALVDACPQTKRIILERAVNSEPEWKFGIVGNVKFVENGSDLVHKISSGYAGYSQGETDAYLGRWPGGPVSCKKLCDVVSAEHQNICKGCRFYSQDSYPVHVAEQVEQMPPLLIQEVVDDVIVTREVPEPPAPYKRIKPHGIGVLKEDDKGKTYIEPIYRYDLYPVDRASNVKHETEQQFWRAHLPHDTVRDFAVDAGTFVDERSLQSRLAHIGIYTSNFKALRSYMSAYIQELQSKTPVSEQFNHLGWVAGNTKFVMPGKIFQSDGKSVQASLGPAATSSSKFVNTKGDIDEQVRLLHFYDDQRYVAHQAYIMSSLGSLLLHMVGYQGLIVNATGDTGASKSTALYTAASFFGPPRKYTMSGMTEGSTANARNLRREVLSNLPMCIDEITMFAADAAREMALGSSQQGGKIRLKQDGSEREAVNDERSQIMLTTSNKSLHGMIANNNAAGTAAAVRVIELRFNRLDVHKGWEADEYLAGISENYGWIGQRFIQVVTANYDKVKKRCIAVSKELAIAAGMKPYERFFFADAACKLVALEICVVLKFVVWSAALMRQWLLTKSLPLMRGMIAEEESMASPVNVLTNYFESINGNMVWYDTTKPGNLQALDGPRGQLLAHYERGPGRMYILRDAFRRWCEKNSIYMTDTLNALHASGVVLSPATRHTLGVGTGVAKARSMCVLVDMNHPDLADATVKAVGATPLRKGGLTVVK